MYINNVGGVLIVDDDQRCVSVPADDVCCDREYSCTGKMAIATWLWPVGQAVKAETVT